jgi:hypothetical protein
MLANLDPVLLARIQFAFTVAFHIIFPAFTIGLASWLAVVEWRYLKTGNAVYQEIYRMWVKIFAVTFGMGVVYSYPAVARSICTKGTQTLFLESGYFSDELCRPGNQSLAMAGSL